ncbi:MAG TPA: HAMP domain-containing protein, partial [Candidatus Ozemobacteraceae bacterium]|nr:HAMP domain-containing protein [Candidatus Ozemobacteraceae bacterium]
EIVALPEGVFLKKPLERQDTGCLLLAIPMPFPLNQPRAFRWGLEGLFLLMFAWLARHLTLILLGRRRVVIDLAVQIALFFVSAGLIPLFTLAFLGASRALETEAIERVRWEKEMIDLLVRADHQFKNWTENLQITCLDLARKLTLDRVTNLSPDLIPAELKRANSVIFVLAREVDRASTMYSSLRPDLERDLGNQAASLQKVLLDLFRQMLIERGERQTSASGEKPKMVLTVQDILGEGSPVLEIVKHLGVMTTSEFNESLLLSFCHLLENRQGEAQSFMMVMMDLALEVRQAFPRIKGMLAQRDSPLRLTTIYELSETAAEREFDVSFIRETVQRVQSEQSQETARITSLRGEDFLFSARHMSFLQDFMPCCLVRYSVITYGKRLQVVVIVTMFLLGIGQIILVSSILRRAILVPVAYLRKGVEAVAGGDYQHRIPIEAANELGDLSGAFNDMISGLQERERMRRFVSASTVEDIRRTRDGQGGDGNGRLVTVA